MARDFAKPFYNSKAWKELRDYIMKRDNYMCQCYKLKGGLPCNNPAHEVHHTITLTPENIGNPSITMNPDYLIALSRDCHFEETRKELETKKGKMCDCEVGFEFDGQGNLMRIQG